jgi:Helix-turn-helix domain
VFRAHLEEGCPEYGREIENIMQSDFEPLLNDAQAAAFLGGLHPKTVQRMARRREIPYRVGKYYRYRASELSAWLMLHSSGQNNPPALNRKEMR